MPLIMPSQRLIRPNPLAYPAGAVPGIDRSHPAANNCLLSAVANTSLNFTNLLNGLPGTPVLNSGTAKPAITSFYGPSILFTNPNNFDIIEFAGTTTGTNGFTMAALACLQQNNGGNSCYILSPNANGFNGWGALNGAGDTININVGPTNYDTGLSVNAQFGPFGIPFFMAISVTASGSVTAVLADLRSGKVSVSPLTSSGGTPTAGDGTFYIGTRGGAARQWPGWIAAVSYSNTVLSTQQLVAWAKSPWDFWYPNKTINLASAAASGGASFLPVWAYRYNLPVLGTGNF